MKKFFRITEKDIMCGIHGIVGKCPVALALRRHEPKALVGIDRIEFEHKLYSVESNLWNYIASYDMGKGMIPATVVINDQKMTAGIIYD